MKPRYEEMSYETTVMLEKAKQMNDRLDNIQEKLVKDNTLPLSAGTPRTSKRGKMESIRNPREGMRETGEMPLPGTGDDAGMAQKAEKDCPSCKDGKLDKAGMCKAGCVPGHKMAKAQPGFPAEKITDINPHFVAESGGQTKSGYFTTNGKTIETEDAKPKRKKADSKVNMERLSSRQNPHSDTGVVREEKFD